MSMGLCLIISSAMYDANIHTDNSCSFTAIGTKEIT